MYKASKPFLSKSTIPETLNIKCNITFDVFLAKLQAKTYPFPSHLKQQYFKNL